jgi:hypothetical protein
MNAQTRQQFEATCATMDALNLEAEFTKAVNAREWEADRLHDARYDMLAAEIHLFNYVFDIPAYGECVRERRA